MSEKPYRRLRFLMDTRPVIQEHRGKWGRVDVVREDLLPGGAKMRFLPYIIEEGRELVYGGPFCGGAAFALSEIGKRLNQKVTLFYAARAELHPRQTAARRNGANLQFVRPGYMTNVQAKARAYAEKVDAQFLHLGFDVPDAEEPFVNFLSHRLCNRLGGDPPEIWCAMGSGMLARCLGKAFPESEIRAVAVGLKSRHGAQKFPANVTVETSPYDFARETRFEAPFNSCPNYDRKAWEFMQRHGHTRGAVFFNVL